MAKMFRHDLIENLRDIEARTLRELEVHLILRPRTEIPLWCFGLMNFGFHNGARLYNTAIILSTIKLTHVIQAITVCAPNLVERRFDMTILKRPQRNFRPWPENQERLELADQIGFNVSELINEVLRDHLNQHMSKKTEKMRQALTATGK